MTGRTQNGVDGRTTTRIEAAGPWTEHIHAMDQALTERNATTAVRAWRNAYAAALATPARARETYWLALFRARQQGSLNGVLDAAEAFGALGDGAMVEQCLRVAEGLAALHSDKGAADRVRALAATIAERSTVAAKPAE